jgi:type II secretory pathway pseudopilin PulG
MTQRDRIVVMVVGAALLLGVFWMMALKPKRQEATDLGKQLQTAQQRLDNARSQVSAGDAARTRYSNNYATVARLGKAVPVDDDVPSLVYQLDTTAKETGVDFRTVKLSSGGGAGPAPVNAAQGAAATQDGAQKQAAGQTGTDAGANSAPSNGQSSTPTAPTPAAPTQSATAALPPGATVGEAGLSTMPFTFTFDGSFFKLSDFLTKLEDYISAKRRTVDVRGRLLLVNGISLSAGSKGFPDMTASISAQAYLLPVDQGLFDGASPTGPSAVTTAPVASASGGSAIAPAAVTP